MSQRKGKERAVETLDEDTLAALDEGIGLAKNGRRWTMEEALEFARKRRQAWMKVQNETAVPSQT